MAEFTRILLSGIDTDGGEPLLVTQTASAGNTIHTTGIDASTDVIDEVTLFVSNNDSSDHTLNIQFGGTAARNLIGPVRIPAGVGEMLVLSNACLAGTGAAGRVVRVYADQANFLVITGYVSRYTT